MSALRADDPRQLGSYRLSRRLGQGGQGVVYLGHSEQGAQVAIKLLHASLSGDPDVRRRFLGEVEAVRRVAAFCTAQLLDADLEGDRPYLVSEYVEGPSLLEHVVAKGPRLGGSLERLAIGTATALGAIHRAGVVHRDFKPGNVLLGIDGPRVIDFGVSRLMDTTATTNAIPVGTPAYLSPERIKGELAGPPADLWAWGLTVVYTATGRHAYTADTYQEVLARILYGKADLGPLTGRLREIVAACLAPEPGERPDAEEVLRRLLGQAAGGDVLSSGAQAAVGPSAAVPSTTESGRTPADRELSTAGLRLVMETAPPGVEPGRIHDPDPTTSFPAVSRDTAPGPPPRRRVRVWQVVVAAAGVAMAVAGFVFWLRGAQDPGLVGTWTGTAEHFTAQRVFPVELRLGPDNDGGAMLWGADLHCSGRLVRQGSGMVFTLDRVTGNECYPGTLRMIPTSASNQMDIKVTREGKDEVTYSGKVTRAS
ncbi:serine/threonine-protein kinase [Nonomuraea jabiensis]|uniref:Serine/threonine protein kinase n=1 Tax=Nonomuraea jabiensis TaxID=882448 RepID=A0A7W9LBZ3_9ACTN|nr:serine/threonine-protein kinase [Nonomuraea jabiensis]MBB5778211.1 serine/threonine protein kinase [Nonomuraea jabiensis]